MAKYGLTTIGFVENLNSYLREIANLAGAEIDRDALSSYIEQQWADRYNTVVCYNESFERVDTYSTDIKFILLDSGFTAANADEKIYCAFYYDKGTTDLEDKESGWYGVVVGTESKIIKKYENMFDYKTSFETYTAISNPLIVYNNLAGSLEEITGIEMSVAELRLYVNKTYKEAKENGTIFESEVGNKGDRISFFLFEVPGYDKEELYIKTVSNKRAEEFGYAWFGASLVTKKDLINTFIAGKLDSEYCHIGTLVFNDMGDLNSFFYSLATKAMKEKWQRSADKTKSVVQYPVLKSYIEHTYKRLLAEDAKKAEGVKEKVVRFKGKAYFNTGLLDRYFRQIFIVGDIERVTFEHPQFGCHEIELLKNVFSCTENETAIARVFSKNNLPGIARYFEKTEDVFFDASLDISLNDTHIFVDGIQRGRIPKYQEEFEACAGDAGKLDKLVAKIAGEFDQACARAKLLAERNYKLAVPQYWAETGEMQFLLPIYLTDPEGKPDCAIALSLDTEGVNPYYRGATILTLDMAYNNARLIVKPDVYWLNDGE